VYLVSLFHVSPSSNIEVKKDGAEPPLTPHLHVVHRCNFNF